jgi:hypothetical protein
MLELSDRWLEADIFGAFSGSNAIACYKYNIIQTNKLINT